MLRASSLVSHLTVLPVGQMFLVCLLGDISARRGSSPRITWGIRIEWRRRVAQVVNDSPRVEQEGLPDRTKMVAKPPMSTSGDAVQIVPILVPFPSGAMDSLRCTTTTNTLLNTRVKYFLHIKVLQESDSTVSVYLFCE